MRESTYRAFLVPSLERPNLVVSRYSQVIRIEIDDNKKATGVTFIKDGIKLTATATKEVILSAGAIGTPHLLMLSGLGPSDNLKSVGVSFYIS
jgi:choline dehydrogenase